jgi:hypothetical protein
MAPFVSPDDITHIEKFNSSQPQATKLETDLIPEPYLGNPNAPILLLNLNPGYDPREVPYHNSDNHFISLSRANLVHADMKYPFYLLDPSISFSLGHQWWSRKLKPLIQSASPAAVARSLFCVEYFPYHSRRYRFSKTSFPSQGYSFWLASQSILTAETIVLMRGARYWFSQFPTLEHHPKLIELQSVQNVTISQRNCTKGYQLLESIVRSHI